MLKNKRETIVAGNWKMNLTPCEAKALAAEMKEKLASYKNSTFVLCAPAIDIPAIAEELKGSNIHVGAQNVHFDEKGAFTGEISAAMLLCAGVEYVIIGHSERRQYFGETDETVNKRVAAALNAGLKVILCVGETKPERDKGITEEIVAMQTKLALLGIPAEQQENVIIAYEPVWAIGTGDVATDEEADRMCGVIRDVIAGLYGADAAEATTIQYGGSMNAKNASGLLAKINIDGGLIGGASLKSADFATIAAAAE